MPVSLYIACCLISGIPDVLPQLSDASICTSHPLAPASILLSMVSLFVNHGITNNFFSLIFYHSFFLFFSNIFLVHLVYWLLSFCCLAFACNFFYSMSLLCPFLEALSGPNRLLQLTSCGLYRHLLPEVYGHSIHYSCISSSSVYSLADIELDQVYKYYYCNIW